MKLIVQVLRIALVVAIMHIAPAQLAASEGLDFRTGVYRGQPVTYHGVNGLAVVEGDIIIGPPGELKPPRGPLPLKDFDVPKRVVGASDTEWLWPGGIVPYTIDPSVRNSQRILEAIKHWNENTVIQMVERTDQPNWINFERPESPICASGVGMFGAEQPLLAWDSCSTPDLIHEIGHAVGLWHEQQRSDRNEYINVSSENLDKRVFLFQFFPAGPLGKDVGPYDYGSIMHYSAFAFSRNNMPTMETIPPGMVIGQAQDLSAGDIDGVNRMYGQPPGQTTISTNPAGLEIEVDGLTYTAPHRFDWAPGTSHTISVPSPQGKGTERFLFGRWSDGGNQTHGVMASSSTTVFIAHFIQQFHLETAVQRNEAGKVVTNPPTTDGFYTSRTPVEVTAAPADGFSFQEWTGRILAGIHGASANPASIRVVTNLNYNAIFTQSALTTVATNPPARRVVVDGATLPAPINFTWSPGSTHTIAVEDTFQHGPSGASRWVFGEWSDGGAPSHSITALEEPSTFTASFSAQYLLTARGLPPEWGSVDVVPASDDGYYENGTTVQVEAKPNEGFELSFWFGDLEGRDNPQSVVVDDQRDVIAFFTESRELVSGVTSSFSLPSVSSPTLFNGPFSYRIQVPEGATALRVNVTASTIGADVDLHIRYGSEPTVSSGRVLADHSSTGPHGNEFVMVTPSSRPPLRAGTYFIALALFTTAVEVTGTLTAEVDAPEVSPPEISVSVPAFTFTAEEGMNPSPQSFKIRNSGGGTLNYESTTDQAWLWVSPQQGSLSRESEDTIEVAVKTAGLGPATYEGAITVLESQAAAAQVSLPFLQAASVKIPVTLVVNPASDGSGPRIAHGGTVLATGTPVVGEISANAIFTVFGQELAPEGTFVVTPELDQEGKVAANLARTCVEINGERSPLFAVLPTQINGQASHRLQPGEARVEVIRGCGTADEQRSPVATVMIGPFSPAFFNFVNKLDGRNPIAALHGGGPALIGEPGFVPGVEFTPAKPGEFISLFGTGFGATDPSLEAGQIPSQALPQTNGLARLTSEVSFTIGGIPVPAQDIVYAGVAPCCAALYQFVVRVPPKVPDGDLPVTATVNGFSTPEGPFLTVKRE